MICFVCLYFNKKHIFISFKRIVLAYMGLVSLETLSSWFVARRDSNQYAKLHLLLILLIANLKWLGGSASVANLSCNGSFIIGGVAFVVQKHVYIRIFCHTWYHDTDICQQKQQRIKYR